MKIKNSSGPETIKTVSYYRTLHSGRKIEETIEANSSIFEGESPQINIQATNIPVEDVPGFINAVKIATLIASGELEIE